MDRTNAAGTSRIYHGATPEVRRDRWVRPALTALPVRRATPAHRGRRARTGLKVLRVTPVKPALVVPKATLVSEDRPEKRAHKANGVRPARKDWWGLRAIRATQVRLVQRATRDRKGLLAPMEVPFLARKDQSALKARRAIPAQRGRKAIRDRKGRRDRRANQARRDLSDLKDRRGIPAPRDPREFLDRKGHRVSPAPREIPVNRERKVSRELTACTAGI